MFGNSDVHEHVALISVWRKNIIIHANHQPLKKIFKKRERKKTIEKDDVENRVVTPHFPLQEEQGNVCG